MVLTCNVWCPPWFLCLRFKAAYWSQDTRDSYVFHTAGAVTRDDAMQQAIRVAVGDLVHHHGQLAASAAKP